MNIPKPLEAIVRNGIHSIDGQRNLWPAMPSLSEQLMAENFADLINSGALSVEDAYRNFWSYEEYTEIWGLPKDGEWRALLPDWKNIAISISGRLSLGYKKEFEDVLLESFRNARQFFGSGYSPFMNDTSFSSDPEEAKESTRDFLAEVYGIGDVYGYSSISTKHTPTNTKFEIKEFEPTLEDMMGIRPSDGLVGTISYRENPLEIKLAALNEIEQRGDNEACKDLIGVYKKLKKQRANPLLRAMVLGLLSEHGLISPHEFAEEFMHLSRGLFRALRKLDQYGPDYDMFIGIPYDEVQDDCEGYPFWSMLRRLPTDTVTSLGKAIQGAIPECSNQDKVGYIRILGYIKDTKSGQFLLSLLGDHREFNLKTSGLRYGAKLDTSMSYEALEAIAIMGYADACPILHKRLKQKLKRFFSPHTKKLEEIYERECKENEDCEIEMYGEPLFSTPITPTFEKLSTLKYEIRQLVRVLGHLRYDKAIPQYEQIIHGYYEKRAACCANVITEALGYIGSSHALDTLLLLHDIFSAEREDAEDNFDFVGIWGDNVEKTIHNTEDFRKFVALLRSKGTYYDLSSSIQSVHQRLKPKGYLAPEFRTEAA